MNDAASVCLKIAWRYTSGTQLSSDDISQSHVDTILDKSNILPISSCMK